MPRKIITKDTTPTVVTPTVAMNADVELKKEGPKFFREIDPQKLLTVVFIIFAVLGIYGSYYFYSKYQSLIKNPNMEAQKETMALVSALGKLIELPVGETPTIATISDKEKLKDQPFFKASENGDRLFAYNTAMVAILYRPSTNKIINMAPINMNQSKNLVQDTNKDEVTTESIPQ